MSDTTEILREPCALFDREAVLTIEGDKVAVVRIPGPVSDLKYIGMSPAAAVRFGEALMQAGRRLDPTLMVQVVSTKEGKG